ncbi:Peptidase M3A/M3B catalytic domain [Sesbania bispinosa]|nr:Peptidase M3A/M3B catalytic domain [Sesbania bispinosa]
MFKSYIEQEVAVAAIPTDPILCVSEAGISSGGCAQSKAEAERRIDAHLDMCRYAFRTWKYVMLDLAMMKFCLLSLIMNVFAVHGIRGDWMSTEAKQFVQILVRDFERNGLNLTASKREELMRLRAQIDELSFRYIQNLNDDSTFLLFNEADLAGLPPEFLKGLGKSENGQLKIPLRSNHVTAVLEFCKVGTTRRMVLRAYGNQSGEVNLSILESLVQQRHKYARLLGYSCYAEYAVVVRMAKTPKMVFDFLKGISTCLTDLAMKELDILKDLKKKEEGEFPFGIEDLLYSVDVESYWKDSGKTFPVLKFEEIAGADVWHCDVRVFSVFDLSSSELLGYCYLDLFSREGKYGHSCMMALPEQCINNQWSTTGF